MKLFFAALFVFAKSGGLYAQSTNPDSILIKVAQKLSSLQNIRYDNARELNYSSEHYKSLSNWSVYDDFQSNDTLTGFKYQVTDSNSKQFYNGTEKFDLDLKHKTISLDDRPDRKTFSGLSALYNSITTLKNILPLLIADKSAMRTLNDTTIYGTACWIITINIGKRRIQNLGFGFDAMTTKSDFIYKFIVGKNTDLPVGIVQTNNVNDDFIKTSFTNIETNTTSPAELSWYYSTYTNDFKPAADKRVEQLLAKGSMAPDWKLEIYNEQKAVSLSDLKGQVVLLDFWIKNCGPCIESVPHLNALQSKFKDKKFSLISINAYDARDEVTWFCKKNKTGYTVLLNGKPVAERYGVGGFPAFFVLDKTGKIIYSGGCSDSMQPEIENIITAAL